MKDKKRKFFLRWALVLLFGFQVAASAAYAINPAKIDNFVRRADRHDKRAEYVLGISFLTGDGIVQNEFLARQYLERSAAQGYKKAQEALAKISPPKAQTPAPLSAPVSAPASRPVSAPVLKKKPPSSVEKRKRPLEKTVANPVISRVKRQHIRQENRGERLMVHLLELFLGGACILLLLQFFRGLFRLLFRRKKSAESQAKHQIYKIKSDFKGRL